VCQVKHRNYLHRDTECPAEEKNVPDLKKCPFLWGESTGDRRLATHAFRGAAEQRAPGAAPAGVPDVLALPPRARRPYVAPFSIFCHWRCDSDASPRACPALPGMNSNAISRNGAAMEKTDRQTDTQTDRQTDRQTEDRQSAAGEEGAGGALQRSSTDFDDATMHFTNFDSSPWHNPLLSRITDNR
jgi:hypothetical protein